LTTQPFPLISGNRTNFILNICRKKNVNFRVLPWPRCVQV